MTEEGYDAAIERRNAQTKDIFEKAAKEAIINPTSVGVTKSYSQYNLHNYRLYFLFNKSGFDENRGRLVGRFTWVGFQNSKEAVWFHVETGWKVTIKKSQVELRKKHEGRDWHIIDNTQPEQIEKINQEKRTEGIRVFKEFIEDFGGSSDMKIINEYKIDNAIKNHLTKKIPIKAAWEDDLTKHLYRDDKIEIKNELSAKNFCHNAALYDFTPEIAGRLDRLDRADNILNSLVKQIETHLQVENRTNELLKLLIEKETGQHGQSSESTPYSTKPCRPSKSRKIKNARDYLNECKGWFDGTI